MKYPTIATAVAALALAGCGQKQHSQKQVSAPADEAAQTYSGAGKVTAIATDQVSIAHGPIEGIGWPAMTMTFTAPGTMSALVKPGDQVSFAFRKDGSAYVLTGLNKH